MRTRQGAAAVVLVVLLAGCGDAAAPTADPEPTTEPSAWTEPATSHGPVGPSRDLDPLVRSLCGRTIDVPPHDDLLRAGWSNAEDFRDRQLILLESPGQAQEYVDAVLGLFRDCPRSGGEDGHRATVHQVDLGDHAGAVSVLSAWDGVPRPGLETLVVVAVGRAAVVSLTYNEGGGGPEPDQQAADQRNADVRALRGVVAAMLMFGAPSEPSFGPEGFGRVVLGLDRSALAALPGVRFTGDGACETFEAPGVTGAVDPGLGVAYLALHADAETPERVGGGSTVAELRASYPDATGDETFWTAVPLGHDDRYYRFDLDRDGRVSTVILVHDDQHCVS